MCVIDRYYKYMRTKFPEANFEDRELRTQLTAKLNKNKQAKKKKSPARKVSTDATCNALMCIYV